MITKIITWIKVNGASILGIAQAVIKGLKEILTAVVNLLSIFIPTIPAQKIVVAIRAFLELIDGWIEKIKLALIPVI